MVKGQDLFIPFETKMILMGISFFRKRPMIRRKKVYLLPEDAGLEDEPCSLLLTASPRVIPSAQTI